MAAPAFGAERDDLEHLGRIFWLYDKAADQRGCPQILQAIKEAVAD